MSPVYCWRVPRAGLAVLSWQSLRCGHWMPAGGQAKAMAVVLVGARSGRDRWK